MNLSPRTIPFQSSAVCQWTCHQGLSLFRPAVCQWTCHQRPSLFSLQLCVNELVTRDHPFSDQLCVSELVTKDHPILQLQFWGGFRIEVTLYLTTAKRQTQFVSFHNWMTRFTVLCFQLAWCALCQPGQFCCLVELCMHVAMLSSFLLLPWTAPMSVWNWTCVAPVLGTANT